MECIPYNYDGKHFTMHTDEHLIDENKNIIGKGINVHPFEI